MGGDGTDSTTEPEPLGRTSRRRVDRFSGRTFLAPMQNSGQGPQSLIHFLRRAELRGHVRLQNDNVGSSRVTIRMLSADTLAEVVFRTHRIYAGAGFAFRAVRLHIDFAPLIVHGSAARGARAVSTIWQ